MFKCNVQVKNSSSIHKMHFNLISPLLIILIMCSDIGECMLNGNETVGDNFKYQIYLISTCFIHCSGVVIDEWHILTAAHCVWGYRSDSFTVYAGTTSLLPGITITHEVKQIHIHDDYNPHSDSDSVMSNELQAYHLGNDVAILTLETPLFLGEHIEKVELPTQDVNPCSPQECFIAGWSGYFRGQTNPPINLLWTEVVILLRLHCLLSDLMIRENEFCAANMDTKAVVQSIDNGGGLVCNGVLVGIMVTSNPDPAQPVIYVNVYDFLPFILEVMQRDRELYSHLPSSII